MSATGPQEAEAYSATEVEAIERDLKCYSDSYWYLQLQEVESCYGPVEPKAKELQALCAQRALAILMFPLLLAGIA